MSSVWVQLISLAMEEHKGQDVLSCTGIGVAAVGRAVFMVMVMEAGREILITECDLLSDYLSCFTRSTLLLRTRYRQEGYRAGLLLIETLDLL